MRKWWLFVVLAAVLGCMLFPSVSFTEDRDTVRLAQTIYALGKDESYQTKLALGTVVMNRVENPWFEDTLGEVLEEQHQFPAGRRYDEESLRAAHEVLAGRRTLDESALYYRATDSAMVWTDAEPVAQVGGYSFYAVDDRI